MGKALALPLLRGVAAAIWASIDGVSAANIPVVNEGLLSVVIVSRIEERWLHNPQESLGYPANGCIASSVSSIPQLVTLNIKHFLSECPTYSLDSPRGLPRAPYSELAGVCNLHWYLSLIGQNQFTVHYWERLIRTPARPGHCLGHHQTRLCYRHASRIIVECFCDF